MDTDLKGRREGCGVLRGVNTDLKREGERGVVYRYEEGVWILISKGRERGVCGTDLRKRGERVNFPSNGP